MKTFQSMNIGICLAPGDFNMHWPLADICMIEIDRWPRGVAPLASHIEDLQRKFEMGVLNRYEYHTKRRICYCKNPGQRLRIYASLRTQMHRHWTG